VQLTIVSLPGEGSSKGGGGNSKEGNEEEGEPSKQKKKAGFQIYKHTTSRKGHHIKKKGKFTREAVESERAECGFGVKSKLPKRGVHRCFWKRNQAKRSLKKKRK